MLIAKRKQTPLQFLKGRVCLSLEVFFVQHDFSVHEMVSSE
jgi:hypothetical protein